MRYDPTWDLTTIPDEALRHERARRNSGKRTNKRGGRKPSCECGQCRKCLAREAQRKHRANAPDKHHKEGTAKQCAARFRSVVRCYCEDCERGDAQKG